MDLKTSKGVGARKENPFEDTFPDPLSKLFPMAKRNVVDAPSTPGRPVFSFSVGSRKNFPSKWDDAEKWLIGGHDSPVHHLQGFVKSPNGFMINRQQQRQQTEIFSEKSGVADDKVSVFQVPTTVSLDHHRHHHNLARTFNGVSAPDSSDVLLKDKLTNDLEPSFSRVKSVDPMNEGFLFRHLLQNSMKDASTEVVDEVKRRDIGTDITPIGSSTALRRPTPLKSLSPPRHNTPAMSGPLASMDQSSSFDIGELQECHLAKLQLHTQFDLVTSNWSSREEEEEDISKSLRHSELNNECLKNISGPRACAWEDKEVTKSRLRYQREEAKIQAWVNLQNAKAEAQSRKLEVKIQKMRSKFEEKMMRRMASVRRKAEELRGAAQLEHNQQMQKAKNLNESMHFWGRGGSCGCFPCNTHHR